jgi:hypothetical protein
MADIDFYGYERDHAGTYLYSSDVAAIYFDNNGIDTPQRAGLVQNVAASYQHAVLPRFEAGSSELYWVTGQAKGDVSVGRLVAFNGLLDGIQPGDGSTNLMNGILGGINIKIGKLAGSLRAVSLPQSQLVLAGCVLQGYSCSFSAGALEVSEQLGIQVAFMKKVVGGGTPAYGGAPTTTGSAAAGTGLGGALADAASVATGAAGVLNAGANLANIAAAI